MILVPKYCLSMKGNPIIEIGKYRYYRQTTHASGRIRWSCVKIASNNCRAAIFIYDDKIIENKNRHNH